MLRPPFRRARSQKLLRATIFAMTLPVAACAPAASPSEGGGASVGVSPSASVAASATAGASQSPTAELPEGWTLVHEVTADQANVSGREVVAGSDGYLAFTSAYAGEEGGPRLVDEPFWHSDDGQTWSEVTSPIAAENELIMALTTTRDGDFLVLTSVFDQQEATSVTRAQLSSDGETWDEVETGLPDDFGILSVDHGPEASLLVGRVSSGDSGDAGAWLSDDGITWERVLDISEPGHFLNGGDGGAGDEGFVVVGTSVANDSSSHEYVVWASSDGHEWVQTRSPFGPEDPDYRPDPFVAALGTDWVAALPTQEDAVQFWFSEDGIDWEASALLERDEPMPAFDPVFDAYDGNLYFSTNGGGPYIGSPGIWTSPNGFDWDEVDLGTDAYLGGMATGDGFLLMNATTRSGDAPTHAGIWISPTD